MSQEQIASALGISVPTLVKYFAVELDSGANAKRMEAMAALYATAKKGNVAACKAVLAIEAAKPPRGAAPEAGTGDSPPAEAPAPAPRAARLGKKEVAQLEAGSAAQGSAWEGVLPSLGVPPTVQ